jgi:DNA mismatch repair ATPase MutL
VRKCRAKKREREREQEREQEREREKEQEREREKEQEREREKEKEQESEKEREKDNGDMRLGRVRATEVPEVCRIYAETPHRAYVFLVSVGAAIDVWGPRRGRGI